MIFPGFPGVPSFFQVFQVFQVEWEPCNVSLLENVAHFINNKCTVLLIFKFLPVTSVHPSKSIHGNQ